LSEELTSLKDILNNFNPTTLIGSSGTFDTLSEIYYHQQNIPYSEEFPETDLSIKALQNVSDLKTSPREQRLQIPA